MVTLITGTRIVGRISRLLLWHHIVGQQERVWLGHILIRHRVQHVGKGRIVPREGLGGRHGCLVVGHGGDGHHVVGDVVGRGRVR